MEACIVENGTALFGHRGNVGEVKQVKSMTLETRKRYNSTSESVALNLEASTLTEPECATFADDIHET
jgi:hypothetical protein